MSAAPSNSQFGTPLDPALLAEPPAPVKRPLPVRALAALALPFAALAGATLLQKLLEGPVPQGDTPGRWMLLGAAAGALLGAIAGALLPRPPNRAAVRIALWTAWGAGSPVLLLALIVAGASVAHPIRESLAERAEAKCRTSRKLCTANEFRESCAAAGAPATHAQAEEKLGPPAQNLCDARGCTRRWIYAGPWKPENWVAPGSILCSQVLDAQGLPVRAVVGPGPEQP